MRGKTTLIQVTEFLSLEDAIKIRSNVREFLPLLVRRKIEGRDRFAVCRENLDHECLPPTFYLDVYPAEIVR